MDSHLSGGDHAVVLIALLYLPVILTAALLAAEAGARAGIPAAVSVRRAYTSSAPSVRMAAFGIAISATVHLALAPTHWSEDRTRAVLFTLDAIALSVIAGSALMPRIRAWSAVALAVLSVGILAYLGYVAAGVEQLDGVGLATKLVELVALGLVLAGWIHQVGSDGRRLAQPASTKTNGGLLR